ncbi:winged helix-turn-helix transcriptional regulator [Streptomyces sp. NPDC059262]|uniref:winged helix-turn-helix transcriptional regulator n=1 Tax=Streptomyces sp. NPDC059262 TaxID=3346797 RepID=UPI0036A2EB82
MISRVHHAEVPPRVEYAVTDLGLSMSPAFRLLPQRSEQNMPRVLAARDRYDAFGAPLSA